MPQKYPKQCDGFNGTVLILANETLLTFNRVCWQKYELWLHKNMHIQFLHVFILPDRHIYSKQQKKKQAEHSFKWQKTSRRC